MSFFISNERNKWKGSNIVINANRLWNRIDELASIGKNEKGAITRFSFTKEDRAAKDLVSMYMKEAGMSVREDEIGNLIGLYEGNVPGAPVIIIGSHVDTVKNGGKFDGALGVLAGIEVVQTLFERGEKLDHPIEVIAFTDEEGSRFNFGMIGSKAMTGKLSQEDLQMRDVEGTTIEKAMQHAGYQSTKLSDVQRDPSSITCYLELHIEQGKVLEKSNLPVGIVSGIAGPLWMKFQLVGEAGHAGATPMHMRKDPMTAFGTIVTEVEKIARTYEDTVATVGIVEVKPGGVNIIPGEVLFTIDLRSIDLSTRNKAEEEITEMIEKKSKTFQLLYKKEILQNVEPVLCAKEVQEVMSEKIQQHGYETITLPSGAGHDAMQFKDICPVGMVFVRSKDGISHHYAEFSSKEDCHSGTQILYETVLELNKR